MAKIKVIIITVTSSLIPISMQTFSVMTMLEVFVAFQKIIFMLSVLTIVALLDIYRVNHLLGDLLGKYLLVLRVKEKVKYSIVLLFVTY